MKLSIIIVLIVYGSLLVLLPEFTGHNNQTARQEAYYKAMERMVRTEVNSSESYRHQRALSQAEDLLPRREAGYLPQIVGVILILVGLWRSRSHLLPSRASAPAGETAGTSREPVEARDAVPSPS